MQILETCDAIRRYNFRLDLDPSTRNLLGTYRTVAVLIWISVRAIQCTVIKLQDAGQLMWMK